MRAQVSKWGNSLAIRLPKAAAASLNVREGQAVDLTIEGEAVVIRSSRPRYSIEELVAQMRPRNEPESFDDVNSPPVGQELL
jgi:antitoxin MazE